MLGKWVGGDNSQPKVLIRVHPIFLMMYYDDPKKKKYNKLSRI